MEITSNINLFDSEFDTEEQIPREFIVYFKEVSNGQRKEVQVEIDDIRIGDIISDNSYENDFYRYHDVFHYTFAAMLGWSPCTRSMMRKKRKSNTLIDEIEDGARATITEEAISLLLFSEAKKRDYLLTKR